ncbi:MAG: type VI secretion system contractile sheath large subunit [Phycisphaerales bacterium]|nr:MAG: type VI secretion system contractile sheath large subunit [Phycisphaerales bacterium]
MADKPEPPDLEVDIPVPDGLRVTADEPYHILVVSDLAGSEAGTLSGPLATGILPLKADDFDEAMATACPQVNYTLADPLVSGNAMVEVDLRFDSLRSFDPGNLIEQLPAPRSLMRIRESIVQRMRGKLSGPNLTDAVAASVSADSTLSWVTESIKWTPAKPVANDSVVDDVLGQIDLGGEEDDKETSPPPKSPIGAAVAAAAQDGTSMPSEEVAALRRTLKEIDRRVSVWLTAVLHEPKVQSVEAAWRSLAFLVKSMDFRKGLRLSLLHAPRAALMDRFTSLLIDPVFDEGADAPDLIVVDAQFGNAAADLEVLDELAQHGASIPAVVLTGVSTGFFGVKHAWQMPTLPPIQNLFDQYQFAKWRSLRQERYARSLGAVFGRCLLRGSYLPNETADLEFAYDEQCISAKDFVWANGAIAGALTVARSVANTGWPTMMSGYVNGRIEGLPTAQGGKKGDKKFGPTDAALVEEKIEELGAVGINAVIGLRDQDDALFWNGMSAAKAPRNDVNAVLEVSLPYQLFASRLSTLLFALKPSLSGKSSEGVIASVRQHVCDWLPFEGEPSAEQLSVQTRPAEDNPVVMELAVTVTPPQAILPGGVPVVMGYRIA